MTSPSRPATRILVVDDEPAIRDVLEEILASEGYLVQTARDGCDALAVLARDRPDLLITDLRMPRLDGWSLPAHVRKVSATLPVILLSATAPRWMPNMDPPEHVVFLSKPVAIATLLDTVTEMTASTTAASAWPNMSAANRSRGASMVATRQG